MKSIGIEGDKSIYTHPIKKDIDIKTSLEYGIKIFVFDNEFELSKFVPYKEQAKLLLRLSFPNPNCSTCLSKKFGAKSEKAMELLQKAHELGLDVVGLTFHVGT